MAIKIAFCTNAEAFLNNKIFDFSYAEQFPGALWVTLLGKLMAEECIEFVTGDLALQNVKNNLWAVEDVLVIQEENAKIGHDLISLGAQPFVLVCLESPMYAQIFYEKLEQIAEPFLHKILFSGAYDTIRKNENSHLLYFPSYCNQRLIDIQPWADRDFLVMVVGNKYYLPNYGSQTIKSFLKQRIKDLFFSNNKSEISKLVDQEQLHDQRLKAIESFAKEGMLKLFGHGWRKIDNLPNKWQVNLSTILPDLKPQPCEDKFKEIEKYKFSLCFENMSYSGYVTEKIIDCLRMGVIPVYFGAPDINDFVPEGAFINAKKFSNMEELKKHLLEIDEQYANEMLVIGQKFLKSDEGLKFSYETFSRKIFEMIKSYEQ